MAMAHRQVAVCARGLPALLIRIAMMVLTLLLLLLMLTVQYYTIWGRVLHTIWGMIWRTV